MVQKSFSMRSQHGSPPCRNEKAGLERAEMLSQQHRKVPQSKHKGRRRYADEVGWRGTVEATSLGNFPPTPRDMVRRETDMIMRDCMTGPLHPGDSRLGKVRQRNHN